MSMQVFYTSLFKSNQNSGNQLERLLRVARARLAAVMAVRSELTWVPWDETEG